MENIWKPKNLDLLIATIIAIGFPFLAQFVYLKTGALIPMILYYGLAWGIVKWRRGSTGYFNKRPDKIPISFYVNVGIIISSLIFAYLARIVSPNINILGIMFTALIWATINAASEQLLWIYIFESWDLYPNSTQIDKNKAIWFRIIGLLLFSAFVGTIHTFYWVQFLHTVDSTQLVGTLFVIFTSISGFLHIIVWRQSNHMIFTFIPHLMLNFIPLFWTYYSIVPYLLI